MPTPESTQDGLGMSALDRALRDALLRRECALEYGMLARNMVGTVEVPAVLGTGG